MTDVNKIVQEHTAKMHKEMAPHLDKLHKAVEAVITSAAPISESMFEALGSDRPESSHLFEAQNLLTTVMGAVDVTLNAQGVQTNPTTMAAVVTMAFGNYAQTMYEPCNCGHEDDDAIPSIEELVFSLAHGRTEGKPN